MGTRDFTPLPKVTLLNFPPKNNTSQKARAVLGAGGAQMPPRTSPVLPSSSTPQPQLPSSDWKGSKADLSSKARWGARRPSSQSPLGSRGWLGHDSQGHSAVRGAMGRRGWRGRCSLWRAAVQTRQQDQATSLEGPWPKMPGPFSPLFAPTTRIPSVKGFTERLPTEVRRGDGSSRRGLSNWSRSGRRGTLLRKGREGALIPGLTAKGLLPLGAQPFGLVLASPVPVPSGPLFSNTRGSP